MKPLDLLIDEWLHDQGYDLSSANPIHAQALRAHAKAEVIRSLAEKPAETPETGAPKDKASK